MRVLIVEDEALIAKTIRETVSVAGHAVAAVVPSVTAALAFLRADSCDAAILDVNLRGESVEPVAAELVQRRIPFLGLTGYGASDHPPSFKGCAVIAKPFDIEVLAVALSGLERPAG